MSNCNRPERKIAEPGCGTGSGEAAGATSAPREISKLKEETSSPDLNAGTGEIDAISGGES